MNLMCYTKKISHVVHDSADVEELNLNPRIVRIHNILDHQDINTLKQTAKSHMWEKLINYDSYYDEHR